MFVNHCTKISRVSSSGLKTAGAEEARVGERVEEKVEVRGGRVKGGKAR